MCVIGRENKIYFTYIHTYIAPLNIKIIPPRKDTS